MGESFKTPVLTGKSLCCSTMFKSTLFIAVKCCQCSTMQVKQQKKSSNKWNCVVCNQKQSVTKIYAQGYQAKDIRNVVQSFNMSRKFQDQVPQQEETPSLGHFVEHLEDAHDTGNHNNKGKTRTDWNEFMDDYENDEPPYLKSKLNKKEVAAGINVVTELPEDLVFKKPRLKGKSGSTSLGPSMNQSYKPNFSKRVSTNKIVEPGPGTSNITSMWDECIMDDSDPIRGVKRGHFEQQQQQQNKVLTTAKTGVSQYTTKHDFPRDIGRQIEKQQQGDKRCAKMKTSVSKWSKYMTEDGDDDGGDKEVRAPAFADDLRLMHGCNPETDGVDQLIEEEIHPDFM